MADAVIEANQGEATAEEAEAAQGNGRGCRGLIVQVQMNASTGCDKRVEAFFDLWGSGIRTAADTAAGEKEEVPYRPGSLNLYNMNNEKNMEGNQMAAITAGMVKKS